MRMPPFKGRHLYSFYTWQMSYKNFSTTEDKVNKKVMVLIHPFREGNGRVDRMLSILMVLQAGLPPLDFRDIVGRKKKEYILAVQAGM